VAYEFAKAGFIERIEHEFAGSPRRRSAAAVAGPEASTETSVDSIIQ
jgi:hypothetical protein